MGMGKRNAQRLGLRAACKFDYTDYDDRLYYPDTAVDLKYFLLKYNRMVSLSTELTLNFRLKKRTVTAPQLPDKLKKS